MLGLLQRPEPLERMVGAALDQGLPPRSILEVFMQAGLYGGFDTTEAAAACAQAVFKSRGLSVPADPPRTDSNEALDARGRELMATLLGDAARRAMRRPAIPSRASFIRPRSATATASCGFAPA